VHLPLINHGKWEVIEANEALDPVEKDVILQLGANHA
jgi:hypothetical protein